MLVSRHICNLITKVFYACYEVNDIIKRKELLVCTIDIKILIHKHEIQVTAWNLHHPIKQCLCKVQKIQNIQNYKRNKQMGHICSSSMKDYTFTTNLYIIFNFFLMDTTL